MHLGDRRARFYLGTPTRHLRSGARSERAAAQVAGCFSAEGAAPETSISECTTKYRSMSLESHANVVVRRNIRLFLPLLTRSAFYVIGRCTDICGQPCLSLLGQPIAFLRPRVLWAAVLPNTKLRDLLHEVDSEISSRRMLRAALIRRKGIPRTSLLI
jgi:hypothetical protein